MKNLTINEMAEELRKKFEEFKLKAELSYTTDTIMVNWYINDYDYNKMSFGYDKEEDYTVDDYFALIINTFNDNLKGAGKKYVREYKARPEKRFLIDLIKYYDCDFLFIHSDDLHSDEFENGYVGIEDIVSYQYNPIGDKLILQEDQCGDEYYYTIDFANKTIDTKVELLEE